MAVLDIVLLYTSSALVLALIAISGFFIFKISIFSLKLISEDLNAVKRMETHECINQKPSKAAEKLDIRIKSLQKQIIKVENKIKSLGRKGLKNPKYAYIQLFKK